MKTIKIADKKIIIAAAALIAVAFLALTYQLNNNIRAQIAVPAASEQSTDINQLNEQIEQIKNQIKVYEQYLKAAEKNDNQILADLYKNNIGDLKNQLEQLLTEQKNAEKPNGGREEDKKKDQIIEKLIEKLEAAYRDMDKQDPPPANLPLLKQLIDELKKMAKAGVRPVCSAGLSAATVIAAKPKDAQEIDKIVERFIGEFTRIWFGNAVPFVPAKTPLIIVSLGPQNSYVGFCYKSAKGDAEFYGMTCGTAENKNEWVHEIVHYIFADRYRPKLLPVWINEGIASQYDDAGRTKATEEVLKERVASYESRKKARKFFVNLLRDPQYPMASDDDLAYALAQSTVQFLVSRGGQQKLMQFVDEVMSNGDWEAALKKYYEIGGAEHLYDLWFFWYLENRSK